MYIQLVREFSTHHRCTRCDNLLVHSVFQNIPVASKINKKKRDWCCLKCSLHTKKGITEEQVKEFLELT